MTTYADDVLNEDWLRGSTWDVRLSDGRAARTLDEVALCLGTSDLKQVAADILRLPFGKAAPDDLKEEAVTLLAMLSGGREPEAKRDFSASERQDAADEGQALPDGSFPIKNSEDLDNAIHAIGRAKDPAKARAHIKKRARALGLESRIPDGWKSDEADEAKLFGLGGKKKPSAPGGISVGGWWANQGGFSEALVVRDTEGRFVDRLGFGGIDEGSIGGIGGGRKPKPNDRVRVRTSDGNGGHVETTHRVESVDGDGNVTTDDGQTVTPDRVSPADARRERGREARATARQRDRQAAALDDAIDDTDAIDIASSAEFYRLGIVNGADEQTRYERAQSLMAEIEKDPEAGAAIAALINPDDLIDPGPRKPIAGRRVATDGLGDAILTGEVDDRGYWQVEYLDGSVGFSNPERLGPMREPADPQGSTDPKPDTTPDTFDQNYRDGSNVGPGIPGVPPPPDERSSETPREPEVAADVEAGVEEGIDEMLTDQQDLLDRATPAPPAGFDPLAEGVDLSDPETYAKAREAMLAAGKAGDYDRERAIKKVLAPAAKAGGIDQPVTGNRKSDGQPYGSGFEPWHPQSDPAYDKYVEQVEERLAAAAKEVGDSKSIHDNLPVAEGGKPSDAWQPERAEAHKRIVDRLMESFKDVPRDRKAVVLAGPPGAGKSTVIKKDGKSFGVEVDERGEPVNFATLNPDLMKELMIEEGLVPPDYASMGLGDLETAGLIHRESSDLTKLLKARLYDGGYNVILDGTFGDPDPGEEIAKIIADDPKKPGLRSLGYSVTGVMVDGSIERSYQNAATRHQVPPDEPGDPYAGRYVPMAIIDSQKVPLDADGNPAKSALFDRAHKTQNAVNFEMAMDHFDGGAIWYDNSTGDARAFHNTITQKVEAVDAPQAKTLAEAFGEREWKAGGADRNRGNAENLRRWYLHGAGIPWGSPGDFDACVAIASKHMPPERAKGYCNLRHQEAVGAPPGKGHGKADEVAETKADEVDNANPFPTGVMVALYPDDQTAKALAVDGGLPATELHVTLGFLGDVDDYEEVDIEDLLDLMKEVAAGIKPLTGKINGVGRFAGSGEEGDPIYANVDVPGLDEVRAQVVTEVDGDGFEVSRLHGFTPHMTLRYVPSGKAAEMPEPPNRDVTFDFLSVAVGGDVYDFPLGVAPSTGEDVEEAEADEETQGEVPLDVVDGDGDTLADRAMRGEEV